MPAAVEEALHSGIDEEEHAAEVSERDDLQDQAERLGQLRPEQEDADTGSTQAVTAKFITPYDPVIVLEDGGRLPVVPVEEAEKLIRLRAGADGQAGEKKRSNGDLNHMHYNAEARRRREGTDAPLREAIPPSRTNPLFPPLPIYGPPSLLRSLQTAFFRVVSTPLSLLFLLSIVAGAVVNSIPRVLHNVRYRATLRNPLRARPFFEEEVKRKHERRAADKAWILEHNEKTAAMPSREKDARSHEDGTFLPTEGGEDPLCVDVGYYARRVGLDAETFEVQTEDGFIIELWHLYNPREFRRPPPPNRNVDSASLFRTRPRRSSVAEMQPSVEGKKKYPILMMHGLLQAAGAFCSNDDDSLAFYLAKSGYDVWLGNNRCGFVPKHTRLSYEDPRMWAWNIRQMGVLDLPALVDRVLHETGFPKLALIAHSQGTTETFVALAKEQRPDLGRKISVFCALAPAAYAGPLIGKIYFRIMRLISPAVFRLVFGIHSFIPLMLVAHRLLPARPYAWMAYHVFSYLFGWSDARWERDLRARMFQWAPVYVSAESMRWWLGRECFARHRCILATRDAGVQEDREDEEDDAVIRAATRDRDPHLSARIKLQRNVTSFHCLQVDHSHHDSTRGKFAWYDEQFPPLALWVCGADDLVDGRRLLRRFDRGREPHVRIVHRKIIEEYEHLDVIWAMDAIDKVGKEVREVIWRTVDKHTARRCRVPAGCSKSLEEEPDATDEVPMMHSGGRARMASISEGKSNGFFSPEQRADASLHETGHSALDETDEEDDLDTLYSDRKSSVTGRRLSEAHFIDVHEKSNPLG